MPKRHSRVRPLFVAMFAVVLTAGGCDGPQSALDTAGREAERIATLFWIMAAGALVVWAGVVLLAVYAIRSRRETHTHYTANLLVIGGGVALPAVVLAALLAYGMPVLSAVIEPAPEGALRIEVTAKQWWWRVQYFPAGDSLPIETANEIRLPVGQRIDLRLTSLDVIHSFWVPSIAGKIDMFPGRVTRLPLEATRTGVFRGACAEYCGESHALMGFAVAVMEDAEFQSWLRQQAAPAAKAAAQDQTEFLANGCGACHAVRGTPAVGRIGPDLTHVGSRAGPGGGLLGNDVEALAKWIAEVDVIKPGVHMPAFRALPPERVRMIAAYLASLQ